MSTEETLGAISPESPQKPKRVPVASADGNGTARLNDQVTGKRRRVRITTSESGAYPPQRNRFDNRDRYNSRDEYMGNGYRQPHRNYEDNAEHRLYQERYQAQRAEGNFDYNYNRPERRPYGGRPQRAYGDRPLYGQQGEGYGAELRPRRHTDGARPYRSYEAAVGPHGLKPKKKKKKSKVRKAKPAFEVQGEPVETIRYPELIAPNQEIRINKFLANAGLCSRREADALIVNGEISVNGVVVTELGRRVTKMDVVEYQGQRVEGQSKVYVLLNKPKNCVTTSDDPECRLTVMDLVKNACPERIYPVGRLDRNTTGVLLITNDGDLASKLTHPSFLKKKIYQVWLDKPVAMEHMQAIADGIELEDGEIHADALSYVTEDDLSQVGIEIHSGRNRIVRRIFEHFGYHVVKLDRVYFAGLTKKNLPRGRWRYLNEQEVNNLRMGAFE